MVLPEVVTIEALKQDVDKNYSAKFVKLQGVSIESVVDFLISPFPINRIVCNGESIDYSMDLVETTFPSIADVSGFVYYKNGILNLYFYLFQKYYFFSVL